MPPLRPSGDSPQTFGNLTPDSGEEQQWARPRDSDSSAQTQVSTQTAGAQTETAVPPRDRYTRKKKSGAEASDPRKLLENAGRSLGKLWSETKQGVKAELATHRDENGELNAKGELFYARAYAANKNYEEALALYDKLLARFDATYEVLPKDFDAKIIQKERGDMVQAQFLGLQAELEKTFKKFNQALWDKQKGLGENLEGLSYVAGHFKTALEKLLAKIGKVAGVSERRTLWVLLFSQIAQSPCAKLLGEISEKFLLQSLDAIEEDLRQDCSNYERLEIYQSLWISLGELPSDKLRYRISRQGDALADHLSHKISSGNSAEERAAQLILARDYYQVRGDMTKAQQAETRLLGLQKSIALAISDEGVPGYRPEAEVKKFKEGKVQLAKLSVAIDQSLLANVAPGHEREGLIKPFARSERHARHLRELAEREAALAHRSNTERWAGLQGLSLKAASDQTLALQKDSPLIPSILETSHPLLQNQILALVSSELLGAEAPALDSMSELGERGLVIRLFVTRYAQALKEGDASWILAHVSASGLMRWQQKLQAAFKDLDKATQSNGIAQLRFYINALHAFAKLGLAEEVRKISESLILHGKEMLSSPGTLFKDYQKGTTVAVPFSEQDYYHFLLKAAKLCLDKKLMGEAQFLLDEILAHEGEHSIKISQVEEEGPEAQSLRDQKFQLKNIFVLARAYRLESEGKRPEAKALADQVAQEESFAMLFDDKPELQQSPNVANSLELLTSRSGIPASELSDKIRQEELFKANQAAAKALNFYLLELEQLYRAQARSIQGQFKDDLSELLPVDPGDKNLRSLKEAQALCHQLIEKLQSGRINSLREGLDLSEGDFPQLPEFDKIRSLLARFHDQLSSNTKAKKILSALNFHDEIVPLIIELVSSYPHDLGLAQRLLELADDFEHEHDAVAGPLAIYRFVEEIAPHSELATHRISTSPEGGPTDPSGSEGPGGSGLPSPTLASLQSLQNQARKNRDRLTGRADFAQSFKKFFRNLSTTEELISIGLLVGSGFLGAAARAELMAEEVFVGMARTSSGFAYRNYVRQHIIPNFAFRVPGLGLTSIEHVAAFGQGLLTMDLAFNFASIAHEKWVGDPTLEQMIYGSIARSTTLIGFELGGPLSRALLERGARTLGMTTATGHLSRAGQATVWTGTHASGIATAVGIGTLNEEFCLTPPPPGGPNEAWLLHVFGYAKLIWAKALVNKVMGGRLAAFEHQPQLEYTVLLARHRVQIALQKARLSLSPAEEAILIDQLAATRLHNPLFTDDKLKDLLQAIQDHVLKPNASSADPSSPYRRAQDILEEFNISIRLRQGTNLLRFDWSAPSAPELGFETIPEEERPEQGLPEEEIPPAANTGLPTAARAGKGLGVALATGILLGAASPTAAEAEVGQSVATESAPEKIENNKTEDPEIKTPEKAPPKTPILSLGLVATTAGGSKRSNNRARLKTILQDLNTTEDSGPSARYSLQGFVNLLLAGNKAWQSLSAQEAINKWVDQLNNTSVELLLAIAGIHGKEAKTRAPSIDWDFLKKLSKSDEFYSKTYDQEFETIEQAPKVPEGPSGSDPLSYLVYYKPEVLLRLTQFSKKAAHGFILALEGFPQQMRDMIIERDLLSKPNLENLLEAYDTLNNIAAVKRGSDSPKARKLESIFDDYLFEIFEDISETPPKLKRFKKFSLLARLAGREKNPMSKVNASAFPIKGEKTDGANLVSLSLENADNTNYDGTTQENVAIKIEFIKGPPTGRPKESPYKNLLDNAEVHRLKIRAGEIKSIEYHLLSPTPISNRALSQLVGLLGEDVTVYYYKDFDAEPELLVKQGEIVIERNASPRNTPLSPDHASTQANRATALCSKLAPAVIRNERQYDPFLDALFGKLESKAEGGTEKLLLHWLKGLKSYQLELISELFKSVGEEASFLFVLMEEAPEFLANIDQLSRSACLGLQRLYALPAIRYNKSFLKLFQSNSPHLMVLLETCARLQNTKYAQITTEAQNIIDELNQTPPVLTRLEHLARLSKSINKKTGGVITLDPQITGVRFDAVIEASNTAIIIEAETPSAADGSLAAEGIFSPARQTILLRNAKQIGPLMRNARRQLSSVEYHFFTQEQVPDELIAKLEHELGESNFRIYRHPSLKDSPILVYPRTKPETPPTDEDPTQPPPPAPTPATPPTTPPSSASPASSPGLMGALRTIGIVATLWQGFVLPWWTGNPSNPAMGAAIAATGTKRPGRRDGEGDEEAPEAKPLTESGPTPPASLAEAKLASTAPLTGNAAKLAALAEEDTFYNSLKKLPAYQQASGRKLSREEIIAGWHAWVARLSEANPRLIDILLSVKGITVGGGSAEPLLLALAARPEHSEFLVQFSHEATLGLEATARLRNKVLLKIILLEEAKFENGQRSEALESIYLLNLLSASNRHKLFKDLINEKDNPYWSGFLQNLLLAGRKAKNILALPPTQRPRLFQLEPESLGTVSWESKTLGRPITREIKPDDFTITSENHYIIGENKSPLNFGKSSPKAVEDFKVQAEAYAHYIRRKSAENGGASMEYYFYGSVNPEVRNFLTKIFAGLELRIYEVKGAETRCVVGTPRPELQASPQPKSASAPQAAPGKPSPAPRPQASSQQEAGEAKITIRPIEAEELLPDTSAKTAEAKTRPDASVPEPEASRAEEVNPAAPQNTLATPPAPVELRPPPFPSNATASVRSRFASTAFDNFFSKNDDCLFFITDRKTLVAFNFDPEAQVQPKRTAAASELQKKLTDKVTGRDGKRNPGVAARFETVGNWLLEVFRLSKDDPKAEVLRREYLAILEMRDLTAALEKLEKLFSQQIRSGEILLPEGEISLRSISAPDNSLRDDNALPRARYYIYVTLKNLESFMTQKTRPAQDNGIIPVFLPAGTRLFQKPQPEAPKDMQVILVHADLSLPRETYQPSDQGSLLLTKQVGITVTAENFDQRLEVRQNYELFPDPQRPDVKALLWAPEENKIAEATKPAAPSPPPPTTPPTATPTTVLRAAPRDPQRLCNALLRSGVCAKVNARHGTAMTAEAIVARLAKGKSEVETERNAEFLASLHEEAAQGLAALLELNPNLDTNLLSMLFNLQGSFDVRTPYNLTRAELFLIALGRSHELDGVKREVSYRLNHGVKNRTIEYIDRLIDFFVDFGSQKNLIREEQAAGRLVLIRTSTTKAELKSYELGRERSEEQYSQASQACLNLAAQLKARGDFDPQDHFTQYILYNLSQLPEIFSRIDSLQFTKFLNELARINTGADRKLHVVRGDIESFITRALTKSSSQEKLSKRLDAVAYIQDDSYVNLNSKEQKSSYFYIYLSYDDYLASTKNLMTQNQFTIPANTPMTDQLLTQQELNKLAETNPNFANRKFAVKVAIPKSFTPAKAASSSVAIYNIDQAISTQAPENQYPLALYREIKSFEGAKTAYPSPQELDLAPIDFAAVAN